MLIFAFYLSSEIEFQVATRNFKDGFGSHRSRSKIFQKLLFQWSNKIYGELERSTKKKKNVKKKFFSSDDTMAKCGKIFFHQTNVDQATLNLDN